MTVRERLRRLLAKLFPPPKPGTCPLCNKPGPVTGHEECVKMWAQR